MSVILFIFVGDILSLDMSNEGSLAVIINHFGSISKINPYSIK